MELGALCVILASIVCWAAVSTRLAVISTPIFFVAIGLFCPRAFSCSISTRIRTWSR